MLLWTQKSITLDSTLKKFSLSHFALTVFGTNQICSPKLPTFGGEAHSQNQSMTNLLSRGDCSPVPVGFSEVLRHLSGLTPAPPIGGKGIKKSQSFLRIMGRDVPGRKPSSLLHTPQISSLPSPVHVQPRLTAGQPSGLHAEPKCSPVSFLPLLPRCAREVVSLKLLITTLPSRQ